MKIYTLSNIGLQLSHSARHEDTDEWRLVHYLARQHRASKETLESMFGQRAVLSLARRGIIQTERIGV